MLNLATALKIKEWGRVNKSALVFLLAMAFCILGLYPAKQLFWMKCWIAEWAIIAFIGLVYIKEKWLKVILFWCLFRLIYNYSFESFVVFHYIFLFLLVYQIIQNTLDVDCKYVVINGLCVIMLIQLAYMYLQYFKLDPIFQDIGQARIGNETIDVTKNVKDFVVGTWGHTNFSGASLAMVIPLFFRKKWNLFLLPLGYMLFLTKSLGAIGALFIGIMFFVIFNLKLKKWLKFFIISLVLLSGFTYAVKYEKQYLSFDNPRTAYLRPVVQYVKIRPVIGWGLGQYKFAYHAIRRAIANDNRSRATNPGNRSHLHFELIEWVFEAGIVGGMLILGYFTHLFIQFIKFKSYFGLILMTGIIISLANSCSTFSFHTPIAWIFLIYLVFLKKEVIQNVNQIHGTKAV